MSNRLPQEEIDAFLNANPEIEVVELLVPDMSGVLRGKRLQRDALSKLGKAGLRLPASVYLLDSLGRNAETINFGTKDGDPDLSVFAAGALARCPWSVRPTAHVFGMMINEDGSPFFADPRSILSRAIEDLAGMGLTAVTAIEFEFYLLSPKLSRDGKARPAQAPETGMTPKTIQVLSMDALGDFDALLSEIEQACAVQGLPADVTTSEFAPGQFELNLSHIADPLLACDQAMLLKRTIKSVAQKHGLIASFMAKPLAEFAGSGMHIHLSMIEENGRNIFAADKNDAETGLPISMRLKHAIGGLREGMAESIALAAPNANSYRRFQTGSYAPVNRAWGVNNRTVSLRIPQKDPSSMRVEYRVAGADANPYLVMAAVLATARHGMINESDPGPIETGNAYEREHNPVLGPLPLRWEAALNAFENGAMIKAFLGETYHAAYLAVKRWEIDQNHAIIPRHELDWYMRDA